MKNTHLLSIILRNYVSLYMLRKGVVDRKEEVLLKVGANNTRVKCPSRSVLAPQGVISITVPMRCNCPNYKHIPYRNRLTNHPLIGFGSKLLNQEFDPGDLSLPFY